MTKTTVAIIGGGPAGLTLARFLKDRGGFETVVLEANDRIGGKSLTLHRGDAQIEMGTGYTTTRYRQVHKWMAECGIDLKRMTEQRFDGAKFEDYVRDGAGAPLFVQIIKYLIEHRKLTRRLSAPNPTPEDLEAASMPIQDWLAQFGLHKIERLMYRTLTNLGYGFVDEATTLQAHRWTDFDLIWSGTRKQLRMPVQGWSEFWERFAMQLDVKREAKVIGVDRSETKVALELSSNETLEVDQIVNTIPLDDFIALTQPTELELEINSGIEWQGYTTTLFAAENWFTDVNVEAFKDAIVPGSPRGRLLSARFDGYAPEFGGNLYLSGQLSGEATSDELKEMLVHGVAEKGAKVTNVLLQKMWKYFPRYHPDAIREGIVQKLQELQGQTRTWHTGASFSHQAVTHIVEHNDRLAEHMHKALVPQSKEIA